MDDTRSLVLLPHSFLHLLTKFSSAVLELMSLSRSLTLVPLFPSKILLLFESLDDVDLPILELGNVRR